MIFAAVALFSPLVGYVLFLPFAVSSVHIFFWTETIYNSDLNYDAFGSETPCFICHNALLK